jgi:L-2-hydroxyglutarate oxidase LhgO
MLGLKSVLTGVVFTGTALNFTRKRQAYNENARQQRGLRAPSVARLIEGFPPKSPARALRQGQLLLARGRPPFSRLIYPVPEPGGLGVHVTLDLAGQARFGPDVEWIERFDPRTDYAVDPKRSERFYAAIRATGRRSLTVHWHRDTPASVPRSPGPKEPAADFMIQGPAEHGVPGLVNLFGIESPGLTASLALADDVAKLLQT